MEGIRQPITHVNLKLLQAFLIVAETGSFRDTAIRIHRSQSAVSAQIRQLEDQLGVTLFNRTTRRVELTPEGQELLASARRALREIEQGLRFIQEAADLRRGRVSLACSPTVAAGHMPRILSEFEREYPRISVSLREVSSPAMYECLRQREVDFGVGPVTDAPDLTSEVLLADAFFAVVPKTLMPAPLDTIPLAELARLPVLLLQSGTAMRRAIDAALERSGLAIQAKYESVHVETLAAMAEAGLGVAILPETALSRAPRQTTHVVRIVNPAINRPIGITRARGFALSPAANRLAELIRVLLGHRDAAAPSVILKN